MKVMSFNIWNYTRPWPLRRKLIADLIRSHQPDVISLQETRHDFRFESGLGQGDQLAELTDYTPTFMLGQVYFPILRVDEGVTTLTREAPRKVMRLDLSMLPHEREDQNQRVCLGVRVMGDQGEVDIYNTHWSLSARARERNAVEVTRFIVQESQDRPTLVMGDFNAKPDTLPIRYLVGDASIDGASGDFVDCWLAANPGQPGFTYASFDPVRRIDYMMGRNLPRGVRNAKVIGSEPVEGVYPSDHMGILVELDL